MDAVGGEDDDSSSPNVILYIVITAAILLLLIIIYFLCCRKTKQKNKGGYQPFEDSTSTEPVLHGELDVPGHPHTILFDNVSDIDIIKR